MAGQVGLEDPFEEGEERDALLAGDQQVPNSSDPAVRLAVLVVAAGGGEGRQEGAQQAGGQVGDAGVEVGGAVAAAAEGKPGRRGGSAFLGRGSLVVGFFGDVGGQVFQDAGPEGPQLPWPELSASVDQQRLGLGEEVLAEIFG